MHQEIERAPLLLDGREGGIEVAGSVTSQCPTTSPPTSLASGSTRFLSASP